MKIDWIDIFLIIVMVFSSIVSLACFFTVLTPSMCYRDMKACNETYKDVQVCYYENLNCDNPLTRFSDGIYFNSTKTIGLNEKGWLKKEYVLVHEYCHYQGGDEFRCYAEMFEEMIK
jgi:hypothetical protein